jgi:hypothetical protein
MFAYYLYYDKCILWSIYNKFKYYRPGIYDLSILLDNKFYASSTIKATSSLCEADAPFYCPNT